MEEDTKMKELQLNAVIGFKGSLSLKVYRECSGWFDIAS
jgi:hypothetical protein